MSDITPLGLGTQGRYDVGDDLPLSVGTLGRYRIAGDTPPPFDPTNLGSGGYTLPSDEALEADRMRLVLDDERVIMDVIKKFLEMQRDG